MREQLRNAANAAGSHSRPAAKAAEVRAAFATDQRIPRIRALGVGDEFEARRDLRRKILRTVHCDISALTNCRGFPDVFLGTELNAVGLIDTLSRAYEIKHELRRRHPEEPHAQCLVWGIWRLESASSGTPRT